MVVKLLSWNVAGFGPTVREIKNRYGSLSNFLTVHGIDILCLQEVKLRENALTKELTNIEGYESFWSISTKPGYNGVTTYVREKSGYSPVAATTKPFNDSTFDDQGRIVITDHGEFIVCNVYVPNAGDDKEERPRLMQKLGFLRALYSYLNDTYWKSDHATSTTSTSSSASSSSSSSPLSTFSPRKNIILAGDLNIAFDGTKDVPPRLYQRDPLYHTYSEDEITFLRRLILPNPTEYEQQYMVEPQTKNSNPSSSPSLSSSLTLPPFQMVDIWRYQYPNMHYKFTVWAQRTFGKEVNDGTRIDYVLTDPYFFRKYIQPYLTIDETDNTTVSRVTDAVSTSSSSSSTASVSNEPSTVSSSPSTRMDVITLDRLRTYNNPGNAFIIDTPTTWSDHSAVGLIFEPPPPLPNHPPCKLSSKIQFRSHILNMFSNISTNNSVSSTSLSSSTSSSSGTVPSVRTTSGNSVAESAVTSFEASLSSSSSTVSSVQPTVLPVTKPIDKPITAATTKRSSSSTTASSVPSSAKGNILSFFKSSTSSSASSTDVPKLETNKDTNTVEDKHDTSTKNTHVPTSASDPSSSARDKGTHAKGTKRSRSTVFG